MGKETQRWTDGVSNQNSCLHPCFLLFDNFTPPLSLFLFLASCHPAAHPFTHIGSERAPWLPVVQCFSIVNCFFTGLSITREDVIQPRSWKPPCWNKMWTCSGLFQLLFSHWPVWLMSPIWVSHNRISRQLAHLNVRWMSDRSLVSGPLWKESWGSLPVVFYYLM